MGGSQSKEEEALLKGTKGGNQERLYNLPDGRLKDRFEPVENITYTTSYEASIDKFDYLIVFPLTEHKGAYVPPVIDEAKGVEKFKSLLSDVLMSSDRMRWSQIKELWRQASFGTDDAKERSVQDLSKFWAKRTGSVPKDSDSIRKKAWNTVAREALLDKLINVSGLQCRLTANTKNIFCRIRAPVKLLELIADKEDYRLQFRGEVDPGSDQFWNRELLHRDEETDAVSYIPVELEEEKRLYTREEATQILEKLYSAGKISPNDLSIKDETQAQWSLRVHTLERIADRVPVDNKYPAYADFNAKPEKRHLYNTYPSVRGRTLFRSKDRIYLTKSILDTYFDFEMLVEKKVVTSIFALHDSNRGEEVTIDILYKRWVQFWSVDGYEAGTVRVTDPEYHNDTPVSFFKRPLAQPLENIRDYFGEKMALHFAWLGFYSYELTHIFWWSAAICAVIVGRGYIDVVDGYDWPNYIYQLVVILWSETFQNAWNRENEAINVKWGTTHLTSSEKVRPQFQGAGPLVRSEIDNSKIAVFPAERRRVYQCSSYFSIMSAQAANLSLIYAMFYLEYMVVENQWLDESLYLTWGVSVCHAFLLQYCAFLFPKYAVKFNDYENYRTDSEYENALIFKTLIFQVTNNFAAATFTIFGKDAIFGTCYNDSCILDLRVLLMAVVIVRMAGSLWDLISPVLQMCFCNFYQAQSDRVGAAAKMVSGRGGGEGEEEDDGGPAVSNEERQTLTQAEDFEDDTQFLEEVAMRPYHGIFSSYSDAVLQFGFVSLFSCAMPILAVYALVENLIVIRLKAWRVCKSRRPHVELSHGIGSWDLFVKVISYMGVVWGVGIQIFAGSNFTSTDLSTKWIMFLATVQIALYLKTMWGSSSNDEEEWITTIKKRNEFVYNKYYSGFTDDDDNLDLTALKGTLDDNVDVDALNLYDLRKGTKVTESEYLAMGELEAKRRALMKEVKINKDQLQVIYKTESFNDNTGIGETKFGLPLGRLSVQLIEIDGLLGEEVGDNIAARMEEEKERATKRGGAFSEQAARANIKIERFVKVKCSLRALRKGTQASAPFGKMGYSNVSRMLNGNTKLDQVMGPYAPVKTIDAEVIFNVLDTKLDDGSIAFASIGLRSLQDQKTHEKKLALKAKLPNGTTHVVGNLYVSVRFQYSKVVPVRRRIFEAQGTLREVEHKLAMIKAGKLKVGPNGNILDADGEDSDEDANIV
jgi:hypothetical protein